MSKATYPELLRPSCGHTKHWYIHAVLLVRLAPTLPSVPLRPPLSWNCSVNGMNTKSPAYINSATCKTGGASFLLDYCFKRTARDPVASNRHTSGNLDICMSVRDVVEKMMLTCITCNKRAVEHYIRVVIKLAETSDSLKHSLDSCCIAELRLDIHQVYANHIATSTECQQTFPVIFTGLLTDRIQLIDWPIFKFQASCRLMLVQKAGPGVVISLQAACQLRP